MKLGCAVNFELRDLGREQTPRLKSITTRLTPEGHHKLELLTCSFWLITQKPKAHPNRHLVISYDVSDKSALIESY